MKFFTAYFFALIFLFSFSSCNHKEKSPLVPDNALDPDLVKNPASASGEDKSEKLPVFSVKQDTYQFGIITEGEKVKHAFPFTNTGNADLIISNAQATCGCTIPEWPKEPIPPGKSGVINVIFDSSKKDGYQKKAVLVTANTIPNVTKLYLIGNVIKKK